MTIVILFLLYLVLPFAELAAIIVLAVLNGQKKRKIDELNRELAAARAGAAWRPENAWESAPERVRENAPENAPERVPDSVWERTSESAPVSCEAENSFAVPQGVGDGLNSPSAPDFAQGYPLPAAEETLAAPGSGGAATYVPAGCVEPDRGAPAPMRQDTPPAPASMRQDTPPAPAPMRQDTPPAPAPIRPDAPPAIRQGTVALVVGVVFVILAGLIFATTAWRILPDLFKVVLVLAFSGIFFGASAIADHRLNIRGTSKAFYILGSIFLFVAVLAVGYFRLLGPEFSLAGRHRYLLLLAGTVFTELALFAGLRKFTETVYAGCCLSGLTVAAALLTASFHPGRLGFALGMACYGLLVTGAAQFLVRRKKESALPGILRIFPMFATINLWGISALVLIVLGTGVTTAAAAFLMAGVHLFLGLDPGRNGGDSGEMCQAYLAMFSVQLLAGLWRLVAPDTAAAGLYTVAAGLVILALLERGPVNSAAREALRLMGGVAGLLLFCGILLAGIADGGLTAHGFICMGLLTLDITLEALKSRNEALNGLHSLMTAAFLNYGIFYLPLSLNRHLLIAALVFSGLYLLGRRFKHPLASPAGELLFTVLAFGDAALLFARAVMGAGSGSRYLMAAAAVLAFAAAAESWTRRMKPLRQALPLAALGLPVLAASILEVNLGIFGIGCEELFLVYLVIFMVWDILKCDRMQIGLGVLGACLGAAYFLIHYFRGPSAAQPFYLITAAYLVVRSRGQEQRARAISVYGACVLALAGVHTACYPYLELAVQRRLVVLAVFAAEYLLWRVRKPAQEMEGFFQIGFAVIYIAVMMGFYRGAGPELACLPVCLAAFAAVYVLTYRRGNLNLHLLPAAAVLWLPAALISRYQIGEERVYGGTLAFLLIFGGLLRVKWRILEADERQKTGVRLDWFCVLAAPALLVMGIAAPGREWRFACILAGIACTLQYAALKPLRRAAFTAAGALAVLAFWAQPFITWPELIRLEISLIPAAVYIRCLENIWGKSRWMYNLQTGLYGLCLLALTLDAFATNRLADALILEGVCLSVLVPSCAGKCRRWAFISGGTALGVALYVTRSFWLSISWWVYLLAAGIGLILFAARNEMKKR